MLPANEQFPYKVIKEVTAIFVRDGRLLLFAVTDLDNEADHTDHKNTKLEQFRVCNHKSLAPLSMVGGQKKLCPSAKHGGEPPACRLSVAPCSQ